MFCFPKYCPRLLLSAPCCAYLHVNRQTSQAVMTHRRANIPSYATHTCLVCCQCIVNISQQKRRRYPRTPYSSIHVCTSTALQYPCRVGNVTLRLETSREAEEESKRDYFISTSRENTKTATSNYCCVREKIQHNEQNGEQRWTPSR